MPLQACSRMKTERGRDVFVVDGLHVAGMAGHDADRLDPQIGHRGAVVLHEVREALRGLVAGLKAVGRHTRERRVREVAAIRVVVGAEHGDLLGHQQFPPTAPR